MFSAMSKYRESLDLKFKPGRRVLVNAGFKIQKCYNGRGVGGDTDK